MSPQISAPLTLFKKAMHALFRQDARRKDRAIIWKLLRENDQTLADLGIERSDLYDVLKTPSALMPSTQLRLKSVRRRASRLRDWRDKLSVAHEAAPKAPLNTKDATSFSRESLKR